MNYLTTDFKHIGTDGIFRLYKIENKTGKGIIRRCTVFPGIELCYHTIKMTDGGNINKTGETGITEINHCREGLFECTFLNGNSLSLKKGEISVNTLANKTKTTNFPKAYYSGASIILDERKAAHTLHRLQPVLEDAKPDVSALNTLFSTNEQSRILPAAQITEPIFNGIYEPLSMYTLPYLRLKVMELLLVLSSLETNSGKTQPFFSDFYIYRVKEIHDYLITHPDSVLSQKQLAASFGISLTVMKACFKYLYGSPLFQYMRTYKMQYAAQLLKNTDKTILEIALEVGYQNPAKFAQAFRQECHILPSDYRTAFKTGILAAPY